MQETRFMNVLKLKKIIKEFAGMKRIYCVLIGSNLFISPIVMTSNFLVGIVVIMPSRSRIKPDANGYFNFLNLAWSNHLHSKFFITGTKK